MFKTAIGVTEDSSSTCYLRPETAPVSYTHLDVYKRQDKLMAKLFKATPLEDSFSANFNILVSGQPRVRCV